MEIKLNEVEQRLIRFIAKLRYEHDRRVGATPTIYHEASALENEVNSMGAELAYCKLMNCYPDLDPEHFGSFDALRNDGLTVDVKHTTRPGGRLLVKAKRRINSPDIYALMVGEFPVYRYAGEIAADEILKGCNIDNSLAHPAYSISQSDLSKELTTHEWKK